LSWFCNLVDTYDRLSDIVGIPDKDGNILLPLNHTMKITDICVTISSNGSFRFAELSKLPIIIPCTEKSSTGRTSGIAPHPLHEELQYLAISKHHHEEYIKQLAAWSGLHCKVKLVHKYIIGGTLISDLHGSDIKTTNPKLFVRFSVEIPNDLTPHLWEDKTIAEAWLKYYSQQLKTRNIALCYATGQMAPIAINHPSGISRAKERNKAKMISYQGYKDKNYTVYGRFTKADEANAISTEASEKAHATLKYLIESQGYECDTQAIVAWAINDGNAAANPFSDSLGLYEETSQTDMDKIIAAQGAIDVNYARKLRSSLVGLGSVISLNKNTRHIAVLAVDAVDKGNIAVTYYQDMPEKDYIDRIITWHESCCWHFRNKGVSYISAPSVDRIIAAVYGEPKGDNYNKIKKQARERLLHCILNGESIDYGWLSAAVCRVSNPFSYEKKDKRWDKINWETAIGVTCAIAKKYYADKKEEFSLELDKKCDNRDYLYGRLLALADKIESYARFLQTGKDDTDKRATNAVRYMSAFAAKPFRTWRLIYDQLSPYLQRLHGGEWYQWQIDEIMSLFIEGEYETDKPLNGKYLMGYSLQRRALNIKNNEEVKKNVKQKD